MTHQHALPVRLLRDVVVGAEDPELALAHLLLEEVDDLLGRPGAQGLVAARGGARERRPGPAGDEQVDGDARARAPQLEVQLLRQRPHRRLAGVVRRRARRVRDPLLRARDDDGGLRVRVRRGGGGGGCLLLDDEVQQRGDPVHDPEHVRVHHPAEVLGVRVRVRERGPQAHARVERQEVDLACRGVFGGFPENRDDGSVSASVVSCLFSSLAVEIIRIWTALIRAAIGSDRSETIIQTDHLKIAQEGFQAQGTARYTGRQGMGSEDARQEKKKKRGGTASLAANPTTWVGI